MRCLVTFLSHLIVADDQESTKEPTERDATEATEEQTERTEGGDVTDAQ